jgi:hypothetical protein
MTMSAAFSMHVRQRSVVDPLIVVGACSKVVLEDPLKISLPILFGQ